MNAIVSRCHYGIDHDRGIHQWTWYDFSHQAVDEWLEQLEAVYDRADDGETVRIIHHFQAHRLPSISYIVQRMRQLHQRYPDQPQTRVVVLYHSEIIANCLQMVAGLLDRPGIDQTRFVASEQYSEALAWLLADD
jgi:hypothetical protein